MAVLREALTRDEFTRRKQQGEKIRKGHVGESVKAFIQNVHHFRDDGLIDSGPPPEHVVIFDEAQRAWNLKQTAKFMRRKKGHEGFSQSEPEFLISYMDRHSDWAMIICLVGGGQEINTGEAGISAWLEAVNQSFGHWQMFISSRLTDSEYVAGGVLEMVLCGRNHHFDDSLHLAVSMRSFRAETVSAFVKALLDGERFIAQKAFTQFAVSHPMALTRDLEVAKKWIRAARGVPSGSDWLPRPGHYGSNHTRSTFGSPLIRCITSSMGARTRDRAITEDAATEFQVQGLELDWVCVAWDADFRATGTGGLITISGESLVQHFEWDNRSFLRNAYRVLLTRARQGMIIFIPQGG